MELEQAKRRNSQTDQDQLIPEVPGTVPTFCHAPIFCRICGSVSDLDSLNLYPYILLNLDQDPGILLNPDPDRGILLNPDPDKFVNNLQLDFFLIPSYMSS